MSTSTKTAVGVALVLSMSAWPSPNTVSQCQPAMPDLKGAFFLGEWCVCFIRWDSLGCLKHAHVYIDI